jgi:hypothetical protein
VGSPRRTPPTRHEVAHRLKDHDAEIGQKLAHSLTQYHHDLVLPEIDALAERIAHLEQPWYRRLWQWVRQTGGADE